MMKKTLWTKTIAAAGLSCLTVGGVASAQNAAPPAAAAPAPAREESPNLADKDLPGPIDNIQDLEDTGKMLFKVADTNNDGQISQKEATDAGNLLAGGFFFRADQNGDGTLSKEEAQAARESLFRQQPLLRFVLQRGKAGVQQSGNAAAANAAANPTATIGNLLDTNNDKQLQASEVRQAVQTGVQGVFATADTNRDGQLSPTEINAGIIGVGKTLARAGFQAADADNNGQVSKAEFDKAIIEPANVAFTIFDANNDGQISPQEMQTAEQIIGSQLRNLRVPEPSNSVGNLLGNARTPQDAGAPARPAATPAPAQPR